MGWWLDLKWVRLRSWLLIWLEQPNLQGLRSINQVMGTGGVVTLSNTEGRVEGAPTCRASLGVSLATLAVPLPLVLSLSLRFFSGSTADDFPLAVPARVLRRAGFLTP
eukprot:GHVT01092465.1.p2 GENE.GHVT01092465.1~~GHVT01092465.1.p2  ORF type:complete len:108 (-),score=5.95 GHVT01092465.1:146-469(-)